MPGYKLYGEQEEGLYNPRLGWVSMEVKIKCLEGQGCL